MGQLFSASFQFYNVYIISSLTISSALARIFSFFLSTTSDFPISKDYLKDYLDDNIPLWSSYFELFAERLQDIDTQIYNITSFAQFLHIGVFIMMSGEIVIRKGKLCNGYFGSNILLIKYIAIVFIKISLQPALK